MGGGLAGGFVGAGAELGGEGAVGGAVVLGVFDGELVQARDGGGAGELREPRGLLFGGLGEGVEDGAGLRVVEGGQELAHGQAVVGGELGEGEVAGEVVVEERVAVEG